jgi:hypothetical protein
MGVAPEEIPKGLPHLTLAHNSTCNQDISQPKLLATQTSDTSLERGKQMAASLGL